MLTWCVNTIKVPGPRQPNSSLRERAVRDGSSSGVPKKELKADSGRSL
jgi:hypothetical protein